MTGVQTCALPISNNVTNIVTINLANHIPLDVTNGWPVNVANVIAIGLTVGVTNTRSIQNLYSHWCCASAGYTIPRSMQHH